MTLQNKIIYGILIAIAVATGIYFVFAATQSVRITAYVPGEVRTNVLGWSYGNSGGNNTVVAPNPPSVFTNLKRSSLIDFSVLVYWYRRDNPPAHIDLNGDGAINIIDFSIFAFNHGDIL